MSCRSNGCCLASAQKCSRAARSRCAPDWIFASTTTGNGCPRRDLGYTNIAAPRPLLESTVLARLLRKPNVRVRNDTVVDGYSFEERTAVNGLDWSANG